MASLPEATQSAPEETRRKVTDWNSERLERAGFFPDVWGDATIHQLAYSQCISASLSKASRELPESMQSMKTCRKGQFDEINVSGQTKSDKGMGLSHVVEKVLKQQVKVVKK